MPAMSPTMTEGNIASWKVKEGDAFSTGDVLLEIETDKAQMDVEAQDDGKMAKIMQQAGSKNIKVGTRIAVIAETDDDLDTLALPAEEAGSPQQATQYQSGPPQPSQSGTEVEASSSPTAKHHPPPKSSETSASSQQSRKARKQIYPLYPSVAQLLHEAGIPTSETNKIPSSGPRGRLLKGDVLAYIGKISSSYSHDQSARISKLGHLDLSNIKAAPPKKMDTPVTGRAQLPEEPKEWPVDTEVSIPITLSAVLSVQKRIQATLGITLPLSTFIARAAELANGDLPRSATTKPTADELFDDILGLCKTSSNSFKGKYIPQISTLPRKSAIQRDTLPTPTNVYDILTSSTTGITKKSSKPSSKPQESDSGDAMNVISVNAGEGEEKTARVFLERMKTILQVEPGRLIL